MVIIHTEPGNDSECCLVDQVAQLAYNRKDHFKKKEDHLMPKKKKTNTAFLKMAQAPLKPSPQLAEVLGSATPISRPQVAKKVWAYIKKHKLQDPKKRREIVADEKLKPVFGKARLDMFQMTKAISKHLSK
jgi:upstream activation factor subunit UAF30